MDKGLACWSNRRILVKVKVLVNTIATEVKQYIRLRCTLRRLARHPALATTVYLIVEHGNLRKFRWDQIRGNRGSKGMAGIFAKYSAKMVVRLRKA